MSGPVQVLNVPAAIRPVFDEIVAVIDTFCVQSRPSSVRPG
jgi:hypothetical protein